MKYSRILFALVLALVIGCGGDDSNGNEPVDPDAIPADEVRVLDEEARQSLNQFDFDLETNTGTLRFDAESSFASQIDENRILASRPVDEVAPAGLLQRVESVTNEGGEIVVSTRQATLAETFEQAEFEETRNLDGDDIQAAEPLADGVSFETIDSGLKQKNSQLGQPFQLNFDRVLIDADGDEDTTNDQVKLNGNVMFAASFDAALNVGAFKLNRFLFAVDIEESIDLEVVGEFDQANLDQKTEIARLDINTIVFQVGPVPVVITIELVVSIGVDGTLTAEFRAAASQSTSLRLGAEYTDSDGWNGLNETDSSFRFEEPEFSLSDANARGYVRPQLEIKLYDIAGPFVFAEPYVRFDAELYRNPYWELYGGLNFGVGFVVTVPVLGEVTSYEASIPAFEEEIGTSPNGAPEVKVISPEDGSNITAGETLELTLTALDREQTFVSVTVQGDGISESVSPVEGEEITVEIDDLCQGTQNLTIEAVDNEGLTTTTNYSVIVENAVPEVTIDDSTLVGSSAPPIFPGGYLSASAAVDDPRCSSANPVDVDRIEWYLDGTRISRSADLLTRLNPGEYTASDTVSIEARFNDGMDTGQSGSIDVTLESEPPGDLPAEVNITQCEVCGGSVIFAGTNLYFPDEVTLQGVAFDPKDGELPGSEMTWQIQNEDEASRQTIGTGRTITFKFSDYYPNPADFEGTTTIYLSVEDGGQTIEDTGEVFFFIGG